MLGDRGGERGFSREFSPSFSCGVLPASCRVRAKKLRSCRCLRRNHGRSCRGPEQHFYNTPLISRVGHSAASSRPFELAQAGHGLSPHGLTPLPGFLGDLPAGFFSLICILLRSRTFPTGQLGPVARELRRGSGTSNTQPPPARVAWAGDHRLPGQARVAVYEDEDGGPDGETGHSDQP